MMLNQVDDLEQMALTDWRGVAKTLREHDCFDGYFKFGFVRNPWDRFVSYYSMMIRNLVEGGAGSGSRWRCLNCDVSFTNTRRAPKDPVRPDGTTGAMLPCPHCYKRQAVLETLAPDVRDRVPTPEKPIWDMLLKMPDLGFGAFTAMLAGLDNYGDGIGWTGPYAYLRSQAEILSCDGKLFLDATCRFEDYATELPRIFDQIGLDATTTIPRINASPHRPYREFYGIAEREFIKRVNAADIETFGYTF
jgi:hypothetical protein